MASPHLETLLLHLSDGSWHSGEDLAEACSVSRSMVSRYMQQMRDQGWLVSAQHGVGYRLDSLPQWLNPAALQRCVPIPLRVLPETTSTNADLMHLPDDQAHPQMLLAERQSAGRGRRGQVWQSPLACNVYLSMGWRFERFRPDFGTLPLMLGVACAEALRPWAEVRLKWPNDLWVEGRKLGGILVESRGEVGGQVWVVAGVGINVGMKAHPSIDQPWCSLDAPRQAVAEAVVRAVYRQLSQFNGLDPARWAALDALYGQSVQTSDGVSGIADGVNADGSLRLKRGGEWVAVHAGEVSVRRGR